MNNAICLLGIVPIRLKPSDASEMISQLVFGDQFIVQESNEKWVYGHSLFDNYKGWVDKKQITFIDTTILNTKKIKTKLYCIALSSTIQLADQNIPITFGAHISSSFFDKKELDIQYIESHFVKAKRNTPLVALARKWLNAPLFMGRENTLWC